MSKIAALIFTVALLAGSYYFNRDESGNTNHKTDIVSGINPSGEKNTLKIIKNEQVDNQIKDVESNLQNSMRDDGFGIHVVAPKTTKFDSQSSTIPVSNSEVISTN